MTSHLTDGAFLIAGALALAVDLALRGGTGDVSMATALLLVATAVALLALGRSASGEDRAALGLVAGLAVTVLLLVGQHGRGLEWRLADPSRAGAAGVRGLGIVLGWMLLSTLGGTLLLAADRLCGGASPRAAIVGRRMHILAVALGIIAFGLAARQAWSMPTGALGGIADLAGGIVAGTWLLAWGAVALLSSASTPAERPAAPLVTIAAGLAAVALVAGGYEAWQQHGSYLAGTTRGVLVAALGGIAAVQPTRGALVRVLLFSGALVAALVG